MVRLICVNIVSITNLARPLDTSFPFARMGEATNCSLCRSIANAHPQNIMDALLVSILAVTVGEIGDKTQLLALLLAARYRRPLPIIAGIFVATLANHALAGLLGHWVVTNVAPDILRWALGLSFLAIAAWTLKPDEIEDTQLNEGKFGVFLLTCVTFFLAEIGDKTQVATVALAAKYSNLYLVVAGTTIGMLIADVPAVFLGKVASPNFPFKLVRWIAASVFAVLGAIVLFKVF